MLFLVTLVFLLRLPICLRRCLPGPVVFVSPGQASTLTWLCPYCKRWHTFRVSVTGWNGNSRKPTIHSCVYFGKGRGWPYECDTTVFEGYAYLHKSSVRLPPKGAGIVRLLYPFVWISLAYLPRRKLKPLYKRPPEVVGYKTFDIREEKMRVLKRIREGQDV